MKSVLPSSVAKYFWGDDLSQLDLKLHRNYIIQNILEMGDRQAVSWLFSQFHRNEINKVLPKLKLTPKSKNFWNLYLN